MKKYKRKVLTLTAALNAMRLGHPLMVMHNNMAAGQAYYVAPDGEVSERNALKIIERPDVQPYDGGLFPGCAQSWKMGA